MSLDTAHLQAMSLAVNDEAQRVWIRGGANVEQPRAQRVIVQTAREADVIYHAWAKLKHARRISIGGGWSMTVQQARAIGELKW